MCTSSRAQAAETASSDAWETAHGLNPQDASDAIAQTLCTGYTNLEVYVNALADSLD